MDRKVKLLVGGVGVGVLLAILAITSFGATTEFVTPTDLAEDDGYEDEVVKLEGRAVDIEDGDVISFDVVDENHTVGHLRR
jgi:cytochrome c-type biogenesis protein CcmE